MARAPKGSPPPDPRHKQFTFRWCEDYQRQFNRGYVHQGAKDGSSLKSFLGRAPDITVEEWSRVARSIWQCRDIWLLDNVVNIAMLCSQWQRCVHVADRNPIKELTTDPKW